MRPPHSEAWNASVVAGVMVEASVQVSEMASRDSDRKHQLQIFVSPEELAAIDAFRFQSRLPNRSAAIRTLLDRACRRK